MVYEAEVGSSALTRPPLRGERGSATPPNKGSETHKAPTATSGIAPETLSGQTSNERVAPECRVILPPILVHFWADFWWF